MKAIVYESNTGFTKRYAELLQEKIKVPAYPLKDAKKHLSNGDEIIFMGWLCAGSVKGYTKAAKNYNVKAVCGVGMRAPMEEAVEEIVKRHNLDKTNTFYLQGGYDIKNIHGFYKFLMNIMEKVILKSVAKKENKTQEEIQMLDMFKKGGDYVSADCLEPVVNWYKAL